MAWWWTLDFFFLDDSHLTPVWPRIDLELTSGLPAARGEDHSGARRRGRTHRQQLPLGRHSERRRRPKGQIFLKSEQNYNFSPEVAFSFTELIVDITRWKTTAFFTLLFYCFLLGYTVRRHSDLLKWDDSILIFRSKF